MSKRVSPAQRLQAEIDEVFAGGEDLAGAIEQVAVLGARLLLQAAIEAEVTAFLGRDRYERAATSEDARAGMRNGYCPTTVKTTAGPVTLQRPKVRGTTERFASQLFGKGVTQDQRAGVAGDRRVRARPVDPRCGGHAGRGARRAGRGVEVDGVAGVRRHQDPVRGLVGASPRRGRAGLPVPGRVALQVPRERVGRAGAGRVGHRHRRQTGVRRAGRGLQPSPATPGKGSSPGSASAGWPARCW